MSGLEGLAKGAANEELLVRLLAEHPRPFWIRSVAKANDAQDQRGIDVLVHTDVGLLCLQAKSSAKEAQRFRKSYRLRNRLGTPPIAVVLLNDGKSHSDIRKQAFALLFEMREDKIHNHTKLVYILPTYWRLLNDTGEYIKVESTC